MDFLTIDMVKMHCRIEFYDPDPDRQAEIDNNIKTQANKAEQEVYARIGRNYLDIIKEWGEVPVAIKQAALILTSRDLIERPYEDGNFVKMLLRPYKKQTNNK
jgi:hypothetical protein